MSAITDEGSRGGNELAWGSGEITGSLSTEADAINGAARGTGRSLVMIENNVPVAMRDGCVLRAKIFRPAAEGPYPVLLLRTPYGKDGYQYTHLSVDPVRAAEAGYVVILQDTRGAAASDGVLEPWLNESDDGYDTVEWAASLPYSDGAVGAYGVSYMGGATWQAAASAPPSLRAIAPTQAPNGSFELWWRGGAFQLGAHLFWCLGILGIPQLRRTGGSKSADAAAERVAQLIDTFTATARDVSSLLELGAAIDPEFLPYFHELAAHPMLDPYHNARGTSGRHSNISVPAFIVAGWHDLFLGGDLGHYAAMRATAASEDAREQTRLVVGPWSHGPGLHASVVGQLDFGIRASGLSVDLAADITRLSLDWFDGWLKHGRAPEGPRVKLFVMGTNRWRDEGEWPLARARQTPWYTTSSGRLTPEPPTSAASPREYLYDPNNPVPTLGGTIMLPFGYQRGPVNQAPLLDREDVLSYTSDVLCVPLEVAGPVRAVIYASTSAVDTDWVVKLCDVHQDGRTFNVCDGILRARFHRGDWSRPEMVAPGRVLRYEIDLWATAIVFPRGHRLRVLVMSSDFPRYDRNPNTGLSSLASSGTAIARQRIYCETRYPSHIELPVVE